MNYAARVQAVQDAEHEVFRVAGRRDVAMYRALGEYRQAVQAQERYRVKARLDRAFEESDR